MAFDRPGPTGTVQVELFHGNLFSRDQNGDPCSHILVPHRDEFSETVGYRIRSGSKTLVFIPDIDKWEKWTTQLVDVVRGSDYLLIDGTFYADGEIARPMSEVPHPFVVETMALLGDLPAGDRSKIYFTHFNHSNPLVQRDSKKMREVGRRGFHFGTRGLKLVL